MKLKWWLIVLIGIGSWYFLSYFLRKPVSSQVKIEIQQELSDAVEQANKLATEKPVEKLNQSDKDRQETSDKIQVEQFQKQSLKLLAELPKVADVRQQIQQNPHMTPPVLVQVADQLGKYTDLVYGNSHLKSEGLKFFISCASSKDTVASVRAVCFERANKLNLELKGQSLSLELPSEVKKLIAQ